VEENKQREESSHILINVLSEEIEKFHNELDQERQLREQA
jgi:hypothetical protein